MKRWLVPAVLVGVALGAVRAEDTIFFKAPADKDRSKVVGKIEEEGPGGVKIKLKKAKAPVRQIPAAHILQIDYEVEGVGNPEYRKPFNAEDAARNAEESYRKLENTRPKSDKDARNIEAAKAKALKTRDQKLGDALKGYRELATKVGAAGLSAEKAQRYLQYKIAHVQAMQAQNDETKLKPAMTALIKFRTDHPGGWQIVAAMKTLGKLQVKTGDLDEARKTYEFLCEVPEVPAGLKQECEFVVARLYLRAEKYAEAEKKLNSLDKSLPRDDPQRAYITAFRAESQMGQGNLKQAEALLGEAIKGSSEGKLRGLAHNLLGDYYRKKGQPGEAFWHYLRVDALYDQDAEEHAKALFYLIGLFDKVKNDPIRAQDCAQRLRDSRFAGTRYQALVEKKK